jgi:hypothetical protein
MKNNVTYLPPNRNGTTMSEESIKKIKDSAKKGSESRLWRGGKLEKKCSYCSKLFAVKRNRDKTAKYCSMPCRNKGFDKGYTTFDKKLRRSARYIQWRTTVFERDNYSCQHCHKIGGQLNADHIEPVAKLIYTGNISAIYDINNGRTLCVSCHYKTDTYGSKSANKVWDKAFR